MKFLHSICQQDWKTQQWSQDWKRSVFIPIPKKDNAKECSNYCALLLISYASKVMLKFLQARLQQYMNQELSEVQTGYRNDRGTRDQIANIHWILKKAREFHKNIPFCFTDYAKTFDCVDYNKILKDIIVPDNLICLPRNLYVSQEATIRTRLLTGSKLGKEHIVVYCHPAYLICMQSTSCEMLFKIQPVHLEVLSSCTAEA